MDFVCKPNYEIEGSNILAELLITASTIEAESLLEEINLVLIGIDFEDFYTFDQASDVWVDFIPPNAKVSDRYTISLKALKSLLQEWILFYKSDIEKKL